MVVLIISQVLLRCISESSEQNRLLSTVYSDVMLALSVLSLTSDFYVSGSSLKNVIFICL